MGQRGRVSAFIVEDNSVYTYFLNESLKDEGNFNITTFENVNQCIASLDDRPDIIVLDYYLERGVTGFDAYKTIRQKYPKLPVVILSAQDDVQVAADLMEAGVYEYIEKKDKDVVYKLKNVMIEVAHKKHYEEFNDYWKKKVKTKSIFIVEDNPTYAKALELFLKQTFSDLKEIKIFPVGEVALMELERRNPSVVIMDYFLDGKYYDAETGLATVKDIMEKKPDTKIILLSSQGEINVALEATKKFHCHYVKKDDHAFGKVETFIRQVWA
ncbi:MAG: response regulator [Bacteroidetes bacterium]|nr:response regulator [Bacteroidota bacterium]